MNTKDFATLLGSKIILEIYLKYSNKAYKQMIAFPVILDELAKL